MEITLVFDMGNSTLGVSGFSHGKSLFLERIDYRQPTLMGKLEELLARKQVAVRSVTHVVMGSVVPSQADPIFQEIKSGFPARTVLLESTQVAQKLESYQLPPHLGIDRMANGVAAWEKYRQGCCVIDFGTATTFTVMDPQGRFVGGAIALGLKSGMDCLTSRGEQLKTGHPGQDWAEMAPEKILQRGTSEALSTGVFYGYLGAMGYLKEKIEKELLFKLLWIGTGGVANVVRPYLSAVEEWKEELTAEGLYRIGMALD